MDFDTSACLVTRPSSGGQHSTELLEKKKISNCKNWFLEPCFMIQLTEMLQNSGTSVFDCWEGG